MVSSVWPVDAVAGAPNYSGRMGRQTAGALVGGKSATRPLGGRSGVAAGTPSTVVSATSSTWTVGQCAGIIDAEASTAAGPYFWSNDANVTGAMTAADGSNPRIDLISVQISDPAESDGSSTPGLGFIYTVGTPASTPAAPATPSRAFPLAQINVPRATFGSPSVSDVAPRAVGAGGIVPVLGVSAYPASPYVGEYIDDVALGLLRWDGTKWNRIVAKDSGWLNITGIVAGWTGTTPQARQIGNQVWVVGALGNATFNSAITTIANLPAGIDPPVATHQFDASGLAASALRVVRFNTDGTIQASTTSVTSANLYFSTTFLTD